MKKRVSCLALFMMLVVSLVCVGTLKNLQTSYSILQFLPAHHPALLMDQKVREKFHIQDKPVFIGVLHNKGAAENWFKEENMSALKRATQKLEGFAGVSEVISLANIQGASSQENTISVGKLADVVPSQYWAERFSQDKLLSPILVSNDGHTAVIYAFLEDTSVEMMSNFLKSFRGLLKSDFANAETAVGGMPAVQTDLRILLNRELRNFLMLTMLACGLTLILIFRTWSSLFITIFLTGFCNLIAFAMMSFTGLSFTVLSATTPILVFITVVSICVHVLLRTEEESDEKRSYWATVVRANRAVALPNLLGAVTTCFGFLTLLISDVPIIRDYGKCVAGAIMLAWFFTSIFILPLQMLTPAPHSRAWVRKSARWALWIIANRRQVVIGVVSFAVISVIFGHNLLWTGKLYDELPKSQEARHTTERIDESLGGIIPLEVTIELPQKEDWYDPQNILHLDQLLKNLRKIEGVGSALGLPDLLRASGVNANRLPNSRAAAAELFTLYSFSLNNPLMQFISSDEHSTRLQVRIHDLPADRSLAMVKHIEEMTQETFHSAKIGAGGMGAVVHIIQHEISADLIFGFWPALLVIVILLAFAFRSVRWSLVAAVPNLLPPVLLMAYLVITKTPIKPSVAIIFAIALGLAFNNTVYALNRLRGLQKSKSELPVYRTFYLEGNPCLLSSLVVMMGFSVFLFSYFELNRIFGQCMLVAIAAGMLGDLVLLPALLRLFPGLLTNQSR